jgi:hypothetical protein
MIYQRVWGDSKFKQLDVKSKLTWFYILTGPHCNGLPGIYRISIGALADSMDWTTSEAALAMQELESAGLIVTDHDAGVIFTPNFLKYNRPGSSKNLIHWLRTLDNLPESDLHQLWIDRVREHYDGVGMLAQFEGLLATEYQFQGIPDADDGVSDTPIEGTMASPDDMYSIRNSIRSRSRKEDTVADSGEIGLLVPPAAGPCLWEKWVLDLAEKARALNIPNGNVLAGKFAVETAREIQVFYDNTTNGGRFTAKRMDHMAKRMQKHVPDIQLAAMEIYIDNYGGKRDYRYACGIADRMARLSNRELHAEMKKHRRKVGDDGIYREVLKGED